MVVEIFSSACDHEVSNAVSMERKANRMNCYTHSDISAVAQCAHCKKGTCTVCTHTTEKTTLCFSCYESILLTGIARARRSTIWVWIFTSAITFYAFITAVNNHAGGSIILVVPLAFALSWCLFWGWTPVWREFRSMTGGWGCIFGPAIIISLITVLIAGVLIVIAIPIGAKTGFQKYTEARQIVANGPQMLANLRGSTVQH